MSSAPRTLCLALAALLSASGVSGLAVADQQEATATAVVGQAAPDFTLTDVDGTSVTLSALQGKTVVLEWFNPDCPFVRYGYQEDGPLRGRAAAAGEDVVWIRINSSAPGKQGHGLERNQAARDQYAISGHVLLDESGAVGRSYGARTTPHMFIVDAGGTLVFAGALDNAPRGNLRGDAPVDYVAQALGELAAGGSVSESAPQPYGCSVKY